MYRNGAFVSDHVTPTNDEQVQPSGVDLTLDAAFEQRSTGRIDRTGKTIGDRDRVDPAKPDGLDADSDRELLALEPGPYVVRYGEVISVPDDHVGFVYPRSSLMRNSCMLHTAVWDPGYEGKGEGLLEVHHEIELEPGARIAQFVLAKSDSAAVYEGTYQGENIDG